MAVHAVLYRAVESGHADPIYKVGSMEVFFEAEKLGKQLGQDKNRVRTFGPEGAKRIDLRLQQLRAARSLDDMRHLPGRCHELTGDLQGCLAGRCPSAVPTDLPPCEQSRPNQGRRQSRLDGC